MKIKKIGLLGLSGLIGIQSVALQANEFKDNVLLNVTPGGSYDVNGKSFYTTPSVYFRFGPSQMNFEPIWHVSPPSIGASCSGFNLQGLFVSILGWDRISKMLKSAGASFAWGIVVGLIYSLPGIFSAFKMINAWAKKIMQLLQNACKIGQNFGNKLANGGPLDFGQKEMFSGWDKTMANMTPEAQVKATESGKDKSFIAKGLAWVAKGGLEDFDPNETKITPEAIKIIYRDSLMHIYSINTPGNDFFHNSIMYSKGLGNSSALPDFLKNSTMLDFENIVSNPNIAAEYSNYRLGFGELNDFINQFYGSNSSDKMIGYVNYIIGLLKFNSLGSEVLDNSTIDQIVEAANLAAKNTNSGNAGTPEEKFKAELALHTQLKKIKSKPVDNSPAKLIGTLFGSYLMGKENKKALENLKNLKPFVYGFLALSEATNEPTNVAFMLSQINAKTGGEEENMLTDSDHLFFENDGLEPIKERFDKFFSDILDNDIDPQSAAINNSVPLLLSATGNYLKIYKQSQKDDRTVLKKELINSGVCLYSIGILDMFDKGSYNTTHSNRIYSLTSTSLEFSTLTGVAANSNDSMTINYFDFNDVYSEFREALTMSILDKELLGGAAAEYEGNMESYCRGQIKNLKEKFHEQDIKNQQRSQSVLDRLSK